MEILQFLRDKIVEFFYLVRDLCAYAITVLASDRKKRLIALAAAGALALVIILAVVLTHLPDRSSRKKTPDPTSTQVVGITVAPSPTVTPAPRQVDSSSSVSAGGIISVNEYLSRKNAG